MQWSLSEDSWERGSRFYTHIINRINKFESQIEDLYEDENKKEEKIRKKINYWDKRLDFLNEVLRNYSLYKIKEYYDGLSIEEVINEAVTSEAIKKYEIRLERINKKEYVRVKAYEKNKKKILLLIDTNSSYVTSCFESPKRKVIGGRGPCQSVLVDIQMMKEGDRIINTKPTTVSGNQAIIHTLSTLVQEIFNWENNITGPVTAFDTDIIVQCYKGLDNLLEPEEKKTLKEAFSIIGNKLYNDIRTIIDLQVNDSLLKKSNNDRIKLLTKKYVNYLKNYSSINYKRIELTNKEYSHYSKIINFSDLNLISTLTKEERTKLIDNLTKIINSPFKLGKEERFCSLLDLYGKRIGTEKNLITNLKDFNSCYDLIKKPYSGYNLIPTLLKLSKKTTPIMQAILESNISMERKCDALQDLSREQINEIINNQKIHRFEKSKILLRLLSEYEMNNEQLNNIILVKGTVIDYYQVLDKILDSYELDKEQINMIINDTTVDRYTISMSKKDIILKILNKYELDRDQIRLLLEEKYLEISKPDVLIPLMSKYKLSYEELKWVISDETMDNTYGLAGINKGNVISKIIKEYSLNDELIELIINEGSRQYCKQSILISLMKKYKLKKHQVNMVLNNKKLETCKDTVVKYVMKEYKLDNKQIKMILTDDSMEDYQLSHKDMFIRRNFIDKKKKLPRWQLELILKDENMAGHKWHLVQHILEKWQLDEELLKLIFRDPHMGHMKAIVLKKMMDTQKAVTEKMKKVAKYIIADYHRYYQFNPEYVAFSW